MRIYSIWHGYCGGRRVALKERRLWNWPSYLMLLCRYSGSSLYSQPVFRFDGKFVCSVLRMAAGGHHTCFIYGTYTPPTYIVTSHLPRIWSLQKLPSTHPTKKHTNAHTKPYFTNFASFVTSDHIGTCGIIYVKVHLFPFSWHSTFDACFMT